MLPELIEAVGEAVFAAGTPDERSGRSGLLMWLAILGVAALIVGAVIYL